MTSPAPPDHTEYLDLPYMAEAQEHAEVVYNDAVDKIDAHAKHLAETLGSPPSIGGGDGSPSGAGLPPGGTTGQALVKQSNADGDADWETLSGVGVGSPPAFGGGGTPEAEAPAQVEGLLFYFESDTLAMPAGAHVRSLLSRDPYRLTGSASRVNAGAEVASSDVNGLAALTFPGTLDGNYLLSTALQVGLNKSTVFGVFKPANFTNSHSLLSGLQHSYNLYVDGSSHCVSVAKTFDAVLFAGTTALTAATWAQFNASYDDSSGAWVVRVNGAADASGTNAVGLTAVISNIGCNAQGVVNGTGQGYPNGDLGAFIIYDRVLTLTEKQFIEAHLSAKFGV